MELEKFLLSPDEKPLDRIPADGGFCAIFRTIGCIGDSLSSGEFEFLNPDGSLDYHDQYEYSWGQYIARATGAKVWNFSRGGMTAEEYWVDFAERNHFWDEDKLCQAYIIALGVNDIINDGQPIGSVSDVCLEDYNKNTNNFAGYYARIIQRLKSMRPDARFFLMSMPHGDVSERVDDLTARHAELLRELAGIFSNTYVIDLERYAPRYDSEFRKIFFLGGHMNPAGYLLTGRMTAAYIDYIIRQNPDDFAQVGFIGTPFRYRPEP